MAKIKIGGNTSESIENMTPQKSEPLDEYNHLGFNTERGLL